MGAGANCTWCAIGWARSRSTTGGAAARFAFASELKALWTLDAGGWKVSPASLARFLYWGYMPGRDTIYDGVYQLLPGRILTVTSAGLRERRYWRLSFADKVRASGEEIVEQTDSDPDCRGSASVAQRRAARGVSERRCRQQLCRQPHGGECRRSGADLLDGHEPRSARRARLREARGRALPDRSHGIRGHARCLVAAAAVGVGIRAAAGRPCLHSDLLCRRPSAAARHRRADRRRRR